MMFKNNINEHLTLNEYEVCSYEKLIRKYKKRHADNDNKVKILLLGCTKELKFLCDEYMDLNPSEGNEDCIRHDWFNIPKHKYDVIIGDCILNKIGGSIVENLSKKCKLLILRFYTHPNTPYTHYRENTSFLLPDKIIDTRDDCKILVWKF